MLKYILQILFNLLHKLIDEHWKIKYIASKDQALDLLLGYYFQYIPIIYLVIK